MCGSAGLLEESSQCAVCVCAPALLRLHDSERVSEAPDLHLRPAGLQAPALHRRRAGGLMTRSSPSRLHFCHRCLCLSGVHCRHLEGAEESQLDVFLDLCDRAGFLDGWSLVFWRPKRRRFRTLGRPRHSPVHALQTARSKMSDYSEGL